MAHLCYLGYHQTELGYHFIISSSEMVVQEIDIKSTGRGRKNTGSMLVGHTLNACPPPIQQFIPCMPSARLKVGGPAERMLKVRLSLS